MSPSVMAVDQTRLTTWLAWSTAITLGLIGVLYALARWSG